MSVTNYFKNPRSILTILLFALQALGASPAAMSNPADPQTLQEVNISRRIYSSLAMPATPSESEFAALSEAKEWIARTILLQMHTQVSVERFRKILNWSDPTDPQFAPGLIPAGGYGQETQYLFGRTRGLKFSEDGTVTIEVVWTPFHAKTANHFVETQSYRKVGDVWYLFKQSRRQIPGCNKWPRCVAEEA